MIKRYLVIFLCLQAPFLFIQNEGLYEKSFTGIVEKVLDGDTVIVNGEKIRLYGIDAPEKDQKSFGGEPIGEWSRDYLKKLILNKKVKISYKERGVYGRIIGIIYENGSINEKMLQGGMAIYYDYSKNRIYQSLSYTARLQKRGIFNTGGFYRPSYYRYKAKKKATKKVALKSIK